MDKDNNLRLEDLEKYIAEQPFNKGYLLQLAELYYTQNDLLKALEYFQREFEISSSLDTLYNLIVVNYQMGNYESTIESGERFLNFEPQNKDVLDIVGDSYYYLSSYGKALECYMQIVDEKNEILQDKISKLESLVLEQEKNEKKQWSNDFYTVSKFSVNNRKSRPFHLSYLFKDHMLEYKIFNFLHNQDYNNLFDLNILDVGCGDGRWLRKFQDQGADPNKLTGIDINDDIISLARGLSSPAIKYSVSHADELGFIEDNHFDVIIMNGVFQHILSDNLRKKIGTELLRVLKSNGVIINYNLTPKGYNSYDKNHPLTNSIKPVSFKDLDEAFPHCSITFDPFLLNDTEIYLKAEENWADLSNRALNRDYDHHYGLGFIRKIGY